MVNTMVLSKVQKYKLKTKQFYHMNTYNYFNKTHLFLLFVCAMSFHSCKKATFKYEIDKYVLADQAGVSTAHPEATKIGIQILKDGGNAIDASIAVQFALAVCYPIAGNIGGGGFMIYRNHQGDIHTLDFREKAPLLATETMYQDSFGNIIPKLSTRGVLAAGVPGTVDGMVQAYEKYSQLKDWKKLVEPSIELAKNGFHLTKNQAKNLNEAKSSFQDINEINTNLFSSDKQYEEGELFIQADLAETLIQIRDNKRQGFYEGKVAEKIVQYVNANFGIISLEDLKNYESIWRTPITFDYKNYSITSMGPPSSGGILIAQLFGAVESYPINDWGFQDIKTTHLMIEAEKRAYADRSIHLGDADYFPVPIEHLTSESYISDRMSDFDLKKATPPADIQAGAWKESEQTTHFSIVDKEGNAVSITTTLNGAYGSRAVVADAGFILNNEMDDFSAKVGEPNMYGLVGAEANKIEPGKRMLSSMTPTIVEKDGELFMVVGTPGGSTIITSVFQTILNVIEFDMDGKEAIQAKRFHHQWKPEEVVYEEGTFPDTVISSLIAKGHIMKERSSIGRVEAIVVKGNKLQIVADNRGDDHAAGY